MGHFEKVRILQIIKLDSNTDHTFIVGKSGSGKSNAAEFYITQYVGKSKVIDLYDDGRHENMSYCLSETDKYFIEKTKDLTEGHLGPKGYPCQNIWVMGNRLRFFDSLPSNVEVRSLNSDKTCLQDIFDMFKASHSQNALLGQMIDKYGVDLNLKEVLNKLKMQTNKKDIHHMTRISLIRNIEKWFGTSIFSDHYPKINMRSILRDKNKICAFSSYLLEGEDEKALFYGFILKEILECKRRNLSRAPVIVYIREISNFMGKYVNPSYRFAQKNILNILREGRDLGITLVCDTQRAADLSPTFRRQFGIHANFKSDYADAEYLLQIGPVPKEILSKIPKLSVGQAVVLTSSEWHYPVTVPPTRHFHKRAKMNMLRFLREKIGEKKYDYIHSSEKEKQDESSKPRLDEFESDSSSVQDEALYGG